jgi:hypothetical protein
MKISRFSIITFAIISVSSCAPYMGSGDKTDRRSDMTALPNNYSLFDLARTISNGSVDVFDPWLSSFALPMDMTSQDTVGLLTFPEHPYMLIRDDSVSVYTLRDAHSPMYNQFFNVMENETLDIPSAVPLIEEEPLQP